MRDFDYDELDRAMNQLITKEPDGSDADASNSASVLASPAEPSAPATHSPNLTPVTSIANPDRPVPSLASHRSGGRFMDMVSKQNAVRPASTVRPVVAQPKPDPKPLINPTEINKPNGPLISSFVPRTPKINPVVDHNDTPDNPEPVLDAPKPEFELPKRDDAVEIEPPKRSMPFSFDRLRNKNQPTEIQPSPVAPAQTATVESSLSPDKPDDDADIDALASDIDKTLGLDKQDVSEEKDLVESPFLPDAKVEKRPLGAFSITGGDNTAAAETTVQPDVPPVGAVNELSDTTSANQNGEVAQDPTTPDEENVKSPLPAELGSDILSIESNSVAHANGAEGADTADDKMKNQDVDTNHADNAVETKASEPIPTPTPIAPIVAEANQTTGDKGAKGTPAIYDHANTVNKALLQKSSKKKGGALKVILWAVLLVVLGVGAGAAVYFLLIPNL